MDNWIWKVREEEKRKKGTVESCPFRMKYHLMPPVGWMNDPNGLCQFKGIYQAYFQYSPLNVNGGCGFWGHAVSSDMLRWEYRDPVLAPDSEEDKSGVYSGSALVEDGKMYLFYTGNVKLPGEYDYVDAGRISSQIMVESEDGQQMSDKIKILGMEDYPEIITAHVRDPKVWKEKGRYRMVLGMRQRDFTEEGKRRDKGGILLYTSEDKRNWKLEKTVVPDRWFGYMWECPDIFTLDQKKILSFCPQGLKGEEGRYQNIYQSGYCELGQCISPEENFQEWDKGFDFYAPQTFETEDGRRILIGWAGMPDTPEHKNFSVENGWQHCLTLPRELVWQEGNIRQRPIRELASLPWEKVAWDGASYCWENQTVGLQINNIRGQEQVIKVGTEENHMLLKIKGKKIEMSFAEDNGKVYTCGGGRKKRKGYLEKQAESAFLMIDSSIAELFVNDGEMVFTTRIYLEKQERKIWAKGSGTKELWVIS